MLMLAERHRVCYAACHQADMEKRSVLTLSCLAVFAGCLYARQAVVEEDVSSPVPAAANPVGGWAPEDVTGMTIVLNFSHAQRKYTGAAEAHPYDGDIVQRHTFRKGNSYKPLTGKNAPRQGYANSVSYTKTAPNQAELRHAVWAGSSAYHLTFTGPHEGQAHEEGFEEGTEWETDGITFVIQSSNTPATTTASADVWNAAIDRLRATTYKDAYKESLQKRLLTILPAIRDGADINTVIPNANGTTALHNACGLGDYELVKLLLEQGADATLKTAKGASAADCIGNDRNSNESPLQALLRRHSSR